MIGYNAPIAEHYIGRTLGRKTKFNHLQKW